MPTPRKRIFVSYAHEDTRWVNALTTSLEPWLRETRVALWDDRQIAVGHQWQADLDAAIEQATVAVLLVTKDFLASSFIVQYELPAILRRAEAKHLKVIWIAVGYAAYEATELFSYQAANDPSAPLESLRRPQRDKLLADIAKKIADAATLGSLAAGLRIIDATTEPLEAALDQRRERTGRSFGVEARYEPTDNQIAFKGTLTVIKAGDLVRLPPDDREFIADLEDSLERNYKRWSVIRKGLGDAAGALDDEIEQQLARVSRLMCQDLTAILNFLLVMHKAELEDHYSRYRYICARLHSA